MAFDKRSQIRFFSGMRRRILELKSKSEASLDFAIETMLLERSESYIQVEKGLAEIERMIAIIEEELDEVLELLPVFHSVVPGEVHWGPLAGYQR